MSWNDLSMADRAKYIKLGVNNGITSLNDIREVYNRYDEGGNLGPLINSINSRSNADFVKRLQDKNRQYIEDWENLGNIATHKLSWATDENGNAIVYPNVQRINGELHDFTNPKFKHEKWDALDRAIEVGDTLRMTPREAQLFTENYKRYYPSFSKKSFGGNLYDKGGPVYNADKKRWYNSKGEELAVGHGYWSNGAKKYVMYGTDGSVTKYDPIDWAKKKRDDIVRTRKRLEQQYAIPVDNRVAITQNNKGNNNKDRRTLVSQNQVDSILKYANKTKVPNYEALGLYAQESSFSNADSRGPGMFYDKKVPGGKWQPKYIESKKNMVSPVLMGSIWSYINDNPYNDYITTLEKIKDPEERKVKALAGRRYLEKQAKKFDINISPLEYSLKLYKSGKYNTGDKNHTSDVRTRGNNLKGSPEITEMVNNSLFK